jgi:hypothetical protein
MSTKFNVIFDNGGGTTLQTAKFCHCYDSPTQAARDVKTLLDGGDTSDWDGNEPEGRMTYDYNTERNGGYLWQNENDVKAIVKAGEVSATYGYNFREFYRALGVEVLE